MLVNSSSHSYLPGRGWLVAGGILCILAGFFSIAYPCVSTAALVQVIGILVLITGISGLIGAIFSRAVPHRLLMLASAFLRIVVGIYVLANPVSAALALTLALAILFLAEGLVAIVAAFKLRSNRAWPLVILNGVAALILGGLVLAKWPNDTTFVLAVLFGINAIFAGVSFLGLGLQASNPAAPQAA